MILISLGLVLLALFGAPLFAVIAASAMWGFHQSDVDLSVMAIEIFGLAEMPILLAIPLFTFAGYLLSESGAPARLVRLTEALLGWLPGGLAIVALAASALFTAFTGASGVTIIALGALLYPALVQSGYDDRFTLGLVTTTGSLGLLFAPSLPLILYGVVAGVSIDDLFVAGRVALVERIVRTVEGETYLAVTVDDDPAADLHRWYGRFQYFGVDEAEPLAGEPSSPPPHVPVGDTLTGTTSHEGG